MDKYFPTGPLTIREQDAQIQITQNDIQIKNLNGNQAYVILEPDGGQQISMNMKFIRCIQNEILFVETRN